MMMANNFAGRLVGSEIHGFHTLQGGTIVLFDRKMLRNFRKDGHNWKKKKDGKTVKEAHEHLKVGNEERIHVYYAHGQDNPGFVRRCYWLLDKSLEHIVLVHYRETQELQASPAAPINSHSSSGSDPNAPWILSEEIDSGIKTTNAGEINNNITVKSHEQRLHEINTLEWDDLVVANDPNTSTINGGGKVPHFDQQNQSNLSNWFYQQVANNLSAEIPSFDNLTQPIAGSHTFPENLNLQTDNQMNPNEQINHNVLVNGVFLDTLGNGGLQSQDSFGMWVNHMLSDSPCSVDESAVESSVSSIHESYSSLVGDDKQTSLPEQVFNLTDVSPAWVPSTEKSKILVTGFFHKDADLSKSNLLCVCGDVSVPVECVQVGVYRCWVPPHSPGFVNLYLSFDGHKPISQVVNFEYRTPILHDPAAFMENNDNWDKFQFEMRLSYLLFTKKNSLDVFSCTVSPKRLKEARNFAIRTSFISNSWQCLMKSTQYNRIPYSQAKEDLFGISLRSRLKEWILERIILGCKTTEYDAQGQSVIHLCAILDYTWAVSLFSWSGLSLDFRDKFGWTALHWAAYYGREKMVATLLSAGAKPNLVTDPTPQNPGGQTAADLAYMNGYDGLAAYLSEKALVRQFNDMSLAGNISGQLETNTTDPEDPENLSEDQLYLKDTLAAYRTAAQAAARIQAAFREHSLKLQTETIELLTPEAEARKIVAAMKIQHAFRNFESRKMMKAAARIQYTYRTWKIRREFLNMRHQAIKIQAAFRCFQLRKHYRKILWSVGVVEKALLRWRLKRKGLRGLHVNNADQKQEGDGEEEFFRIGRKQAEERVERSVVRVQAMFRSKKAQQDYRRMKLALNQANLDREYEEFLGTEDNMEI
ncbi:calmodulin-binding transcription activator 5 isoform X5 [Arachis ipaensis]|uniref:calmodulin-binding transcription activator 5 isoform X5 n=1 Tax=Arachis ipaensis TaxID=130454 RepID=UPI000A2B18A4|nr:calmodulin-binding transcription activator 5 isoform X5 [Arachis ipaensis]XP_020960928.1 calmodulin-binding transcription activator 5 isoform X5 [Arachis ipaensis]